MTNDQTEEYSSSRDDPSLTVGSVASDLKAAATHKYEQTVTEVRTRADDAKADVATEVKKVANALRRASQELRDGSAQERTLGQIASSLADASDSIRDKDFGEIIEMTRKVARYNPALFLGGAALLGFVASRYTKASADSSTTPTEAPDRAKSIETFIDEGNPNTQPLGVAT